MRATHQPGRDLHPADSVPLRPSLSLGRVVQRCLPCLVSPVHKLRSARDVNVAENAGGTGSHEVVATDEYAQGHQPSVQLFLARRLLAINQSHDVYSGSD